MNPESIDLSFRPEAPSSFPELDENDGEIPGSGEPVATITTGIKYVQLEGVDVEEESCGPRVDVWGLRVGSDIHYHLRVGSDIHYDIQDEIGQEALHEPTYRKSAAPLTLGELYDFLMGAVHLFEGEDNFFEHFKHGDFIQLERGSREQSQFLQFFEVDSDFYPDLDRLVRQRFIERWG